MREVVLTLVAAAPLVLAIAYLASRAWYRARYAETRRFTRESVEAFKEASHSERAKREKDLQVPPS